MPSPCHTTHALASPHHCAHVRAHKPLRASGWAGSLRHLTPPCCLAQEHLQGPPTNQIVPPIHISNLGDFLWPDEQFGRFFVAGRAIWAIFCGRTSNPRTNQRLHTSHASCEGGCRRVWLRDTATATGNAQQHRDVRSDLRHNTFETVRTA